MKTFWAIVLFSFLVFFSFWFVAYKTGINDLSIQSEDVLPSAFLPYSIIQERTIYLDSYYDQLIEAYPHPDDKSYEKGLTPFYLRKVQSTSGEIHYVSAFPLISGLLVVPVYFPFVVFGMEPNFENIALLNHFAGSLIVSLSGGFLFLLIKKHFSLDKKRSLLLTAIYLFGTVNFALVSQALWQHGSVQLFLILGLLYLYESIELEDKKKKKASIAIFFSGMFFGLSILSRHTSVLSLPFVFLLVTFLYVRKHNLQKAYVWEIKKLFSPLISKIFIFISGFIPAVLFFVWYTKKYYVDISNNGYSNQILNGWLSRFPEGFLGLWFSPSKGILVYSPVLFFSLVGLIIIFRNKKARENLDMVFFGLIILAHTLLLGKWKHWYGGWSFGYRMASDVLPFFILLMVPYINSDLFKKTRKLLTILLIFSVVVQVYGIFMFDGVWHSAYDLGFENTSWLWSIQDSELAFNIRRVLVKVGYLQQACPKCAPVTI